MDIVLQFNFPLHAVWKYAYYSYFVWYIFTLPFITGNRTLIRQHTTPVLNHWSWLFVVVWNIYGGFETTNFRLRIQRSLHWATYQWVFKLWQRVWIIYRLSLNDKKIYSLLYHLSFISFWISTCLWSWRLWIWLPLMITMDPNIIACPCDMFCFTNLPCTLHSNF